MSYKKEFTVRTSPQSDTIQQDPWAISYLKIDRDGLPGSINVESSASLPLMMPHYHLLVMNNDRLINQFAGVGASFSQRVTLQPGEHAVFVAVSYEAPLSYDVLESP